MSSGLAYIGDPHGVLAAVRDLIDAAEESIVLQMYLFAKNGDQTLLLPREGAFPYADAIADWLIAKKRARPGMPVVVILDSNTPANPALTRRKGKLVRQELREEGIVVLDACLFGARFDRRRRWLPRMNLHLEHEGVAASEWVERQNRWQVLHNVEDHRKNLVIDGGRAAAITSHNVFDVAWDWHENLFWLTGDAARALYRVAARAIAEALTIPQEISPRERQELERLVSAGASTRTPVDEPAPSLSPVGGFPLPPPATRGLAFDEGCAIVENEDIRPRLVAMFDGAGEGDALLVASTYFSDLQTLQALARAAERGARVEILVDSLHALPLPPPASWLTRSLVNHRVISRAHALVARTPDRFALRVHDSRGGAMMHLKTAARVGADPMLIGGHANYTPNSFSGAWLETDVETRSPAIVQAFADHFRRLFDSSVAVGARGWTDAPGDALRSALLSMFALAGIEP